MIDFVTKGDENMRRREYLYEDYIKAMKLLKKYGTKKVSKILDIPRSTLINWKRGQTPWNAKWHPEPSPELAYVIGVLLGDGTVTQDRKSDYVIKLEATDLEFVEYFSKCVSIVLGKPYIKPKKVWKKNRKKARWKVRYKSKSFVRWFKEENLDTLKQYIEYNKNTITYFLRGLYDSEGSNYRCIKISLYNTDISLLKYVKYLLAKYYNIKTGKISINGKPGLYYTSYGDIIKRKRTVYNLYTHKGYARVFLREIGFTISRKQFCPTPSS
ncbi:hypothetical protein DRN87_02435 [Candidatus Geothermarchaeota archaeon]|nr:MAG: hypothetical protein DRN87_02435 [Candidatus Geothermarchaeota archaeon]HEW93458.1 hypothetical protein [Thermoprotei archaeon]